MSKTKSNKAVPEGFMKNSQGHMVPIELVDKIDVERDKMVAKIMGRAQNVQGTMTKFRDQANTEIDAFIKKAFKKYGATIGGEKGNVSFLSFDGEHKIQISVGSQISFNEQINVAMQLIKECIIEWSEGSDTNLVAVVEQAIQTDSEGNAIPARILGLKKLKIKHTKWNRAMRALNDSEQPTNRKPYLRLYKKDDSGEFKQVPLDLAKLPSTEAA